MNALHAVSPETEVDDTSDAVVNAAVSLRKVALVLSREGGKFPASAELREKVCLLDNGELLIANGKRLDPAVMSYEDTLRRAGHSYKPVTVQLAELREVYARAQGTESGSAEQTTSNRQSQVVTLIKAAVASGASDMHFIVDQRLAVLRNRVNGILETVVDMPRSDGMELCSTIYQSMCDLADPTFMPQQPQDGRLKPSFFEAAGMYGARVATRPLENGIFMVLRLLYNASNRRREITELGYLPEQIAMIRRMTMRKDGVNLFSGETGSGKSSSLEVCIRMLLEHYRNEVNVMTIEDPIEYKIPGAQQTPKGQRTWAEAISNAMRLDPDVLMVGEVRDFASAEAALQGALTGHGLWSTVHAKDVVAILQRLGEFRSGDERLNPGLYTDHTLVTGLINQNLVPGLCPHCKQPWTGPGRSALDRAVVERVERYCTPETIFARGPGCKACRNTGISGRTVVAEVVIPNHGFMRAFREQGKTEARAYWINEMGGITKRDHLIRRINEGAVDPVMGEKKIGLLDEDEGI